MGPYGRELGRPSVHLGPSQASVPTSAYANSGANSLPILANSGALATIRGPSGMPKCERGANSLPEYLAHYKIKRGGSFPRVLSARAGPLLEFYHGLWAYLNPQRARISDDHKHHAATLKFGVRG